METIKAKEGGYITQATIDNENNRIFVTEVFTPDASLWKDATQSEKDEWEKTYPIEPAEVVDEDTALLNYINDKTDSSYTELGDAVIDLVTNK